MTQPSPPPDGTLFCFGLGYSAMRLAETLRAHGWVVGGTCRNPNRHAALSREGYHVVVLDEFSGTAPAEIADATHLLVSIPTLEGIGDLVLAHYRDVIAALPRLRWVGYLSTTGVYGDHAGGIVDESTPPQPGSARLARRVEAERQWLALPHPKAAKHVFRLSGIYGPGRCIFDELLLGTARRIDKPGQFFSRIHVDDIAATLLASMNAPADGEIYNVCDDEPAPSRAIVEYACELLQREPPPLLPFEDALLSPMAREFYRSNRRVSNRKLRENLGVRLRYPSYREGLTALLADYQSFFNPNG